MRTSSLTRTVPYDRELVKWIFLRGRQLFLPHKSLGLAAMFNRTTLFLGLNFSGQEGSVIFVREMS
jgi:hypothetical protein